MPLAQSSELPPPKATMPSMPRPAAMRVAGRDHVGVGVGVEAVEAA